MNAAVSHNKWLRTGRCPGVRVRDWITVVPTRISNCADIADTGLALESKILSNYAKDQEITREGFV